LRETLLNNYDKLDSLTSGELESLFGKGYNFTQYFNIDKIVEAIQNNQQAIIDNNKTLERNNELLTLEQENAIRNLDEKFADRDGEVQLTNAIVNKEIETNKKFIED